MLREKILFEKALKRTNMYWKLAGIHIDYDKKQEKKLSKLSYLLKHWFYIGNFLWLHLGVLSVFGTINILSKQEVLYMLPCTSVALLGGIKSFYLLNYEEKIYDIVNTLRTLQSIDESDRKKEKIVDKFEKESLPFLSKGNVVLFFCSAFGVSTFCVGPLIIIGLHYWTTNEVKLFLPYKIWYPFDESRIGGWLLAYTHQLWSAWLAAFFVYGADGFFYTICAFIYNQFCSLNFDLQRIGPTSFIKNNSSDPQNIEVLIYRHREIIRCIEMLNVIYEKSTLFNVVSSSFIICLGGFNVKFIDSLIMMLPFAAVLFFGSVQIFLFCYYGNMLMQASLDLSDAIFHSPHWYKLNSASMKCCLFILMRAQKPCKITAFGFRVINLTTFSKILSSAWSYFTLLNTMYSEENKMEVINDGKKL